MHPSMASLMRWFEFGHLPEGEIRDTSHCVSSLADYMVAQLPSSAELTAGLRKLLEAKDCFVRAAVAKGDPREPDNA